VEMCTTASMSLEMDWAELITCSAIRRISDAQQREGALHLAGGAPTPARR